MSDNEKAISILKEEVNNNSDDYRFYFAYDEKIHPSDFAKIFNDYCNKCDIAKKNNSDAEYSSFKDYLEEQIYEDWALWEGEDDIVESTFKGNHNEEEYDIVCNYLNETGKTLLEALNDEGFSGVKFDIDDVIGEYHTNLMFATKSERNFDMGSIPIIFASGVKELNRFLKDRPKEELEAYFNNALSYFICQQGGNLPFIIKGIYEPEENITYERFDKATLDEVFNFPAYSMAELTALVTINKNSLDVLDNIAKKEGAIDISKDAYMGLFDEWSGAGSTLELELDKPFTVPCDMIRNVQIEGQKSDIVHGYTINDTYGLVGNAWRGTVKEANDDNRDEITKKIKESVGSCMDIISKEAERREQAEKDEGDPEIDF